MTEQDASITGLGRLLSVRAGEWQPTLRSAGFFFLVLLALGMLRPVREAMGVERGMDQVRWLFVGTALVSLFAALLFGGVASKLNRRAAIAVGFRAITACLGLFMLARGLAGDEIKGYAGAVFYVWFSVVNVFVVAVFWALMADLWRLDQAKRLYPLIGVGGTLGALVGSTLPWQLGEMLGRHGPVWLMLLAGLAIEGSVRCVPKLERCFRAPTPARDSPAEGAASNPGGTRHGLAPPLGGGLLDGIRSVCGSAYLLGISTYTAAIAVASTLIYFTGLELVTNRSDQLGAQVSLFGQLDAAKQGATLILQLLVTANLIRLIGVGGTLGVMPLLTVLGFASVWAAGRESQTLAWGVFVTFQALHSATRYGVVRPARETLYSVLPRSDKYKAKTVNDVFVFRAGDVAGAGLQSALASAASVTVGWLAMMATPAAAVWIVLSLWLGWVQRQRARAGMQQHESHNPPADERSLAAT